MLFQSGAKSFFKFGQFPQAILFQSAASVISKWGRGSYFKGGECLFQSGVKVISKWSKMLFQRGAVISKGDNYFKVEHNTAIL